MTAKEVIRNFIILACILRGGFLLLILLAGSHGHPRFIPHTMDDWKYLGEMYIFLLIPIIWIVIIIIKEGRNKSTYKV